MTERIRVLFAGESWVTHSIHVKGFDSFEQYSYHEGGSDVIAALRDRGMDIIYQPAHLAANDFPLSRPELAAFDVVILSDIGANALVCPIERLCVPKESRTDFPCSRTSSAKGVVYS